jgi:hypothetical protein
MQLEGTLPAGTGTAVSCRGKHAFGSHVLTADGTMCCDRGLCACPACGTAIAHQFPRTQKLPRCCCTTADAVPKAEEQFKHTMFIAAGIESFESSNPYLYVLRSCPLLLLLLHCRRCAQSSRAD